MNEKQSLAQRFQAYTTTKTQLFWACAASAVLATVVGFTWGGWVTGGTATSMSKTAADGARMELAATLCVERFKATTDATAQLVALKGLSGYSRQSFVEKGGWAVMPGDSRAPGDANAVCGNRLAALEKLPA